MLPEGHKQEEVIDNLKSWLWFEGFYWFGCQGNIYRKPPVLLFTLRLWEVCYGEGIVMSRSDPELGEEYDEVPKRRTWRISYPLWAHTTQHMPNLNSPFPSTSWEYGLPKSTGGMPVLCANPVNWMALDYEARTPGFVGNNGCRCVLLTCFWHDKILLGIIFRQDLVYSLIHCILQCPDFFVLNSGLRLISILKVEDYKFRKVLKDLKMK